MTSHAGAQIGVAIRGATSQPNHLLICQHFKDSKLLKNVAGNTNVAMFKNSSELFRLFETRLLL